MTLSHRQLLATLIFGSAVATNGCYHIKTGGSPLTPPTGGSSVPGSPTPTPAGTCGSVQGSTTALIAVSPDIVATTAPGFGSIGESGLVPQSTGVPPATSSITRLTSADVVQFVNVDFQHEDSAVGLGTSGFPSTPHSFPSGTQKPVGTAVGSGTWSTGRLGLSSNFCYSQTFTMPKVNAGSSINVYYGDYDLYNTTTNGDGYRNVIVVTGAAAVRSRHYPPILHLR